MANIDLKIDMWKNNLLDLGKRNSLLNYCDTRSSNMRIKEPEMFALWDSFVIKQCPLEFPIANKNQAGQSINIDTNQTLENQQTILKNLRNKAKNFIEEQDINVLYLAFGFLRWQETKNAERYFDAPLILVPVTLTREALSAPFILSLHQDKIILNPTLVHKLDLEFDFKLPEFTSKIDLQEYIEAVKTAIAVNQWEVITDVGLSLFSFPKINMYHDLDIYREEIIQNPIINEMCQADFMIERDSSNTNDLDINQNSLSPSVFQVIDADSGQYDAIVCAHKGESFILRSSLDIGKSRTITRIIAECLAEGKKVLFVSEKMADIEMVYQRLNDANLADFCLFMQGHKVNKKELLTDLGNDFEVFKANANLSDESYQSLEQLAITKERLDGYSDAMYAVIEPLHKTIHEVISHLINLGDYQDISFPISHVRETTLPVYLNYINGLAHFADTVSNMSCNCECNPWYGAKIPVVNDEVWQEIDFYLNKLLPKAQRMIELCDEIEADLGICFEKSYVGLEYLVKVLVVAVQSPKIPMNWILNDDISLLLEDVQKCGQDKSEFVNARLEVLRLYQDLEARNVTDFSVYGNLATIEEIKQDGMAINALIKKDALYKVWSDDDDEQYLGTLYQFVEQRIREYYFLYDEILELYEEEIFSIDYNAIYSKFKTDYTSIFKMFKSGYKADRKLFQDLYCGADEVVSDEEIIEVLEKLCRMNQLRLELAGKEALLKKYFGQYYRGESTDTTELEAQMEVYGLLCECQVALKRLATSVMVCEGQREILRRRYGTLYTGLETDWDAVSKALNWAIEFKTELGDLSRNQVFIKSICNSDKMIRLCGKYVFRIQTALNNFKTEFQWYLKLFASEEREILKNSQLSILVSRLEASLESFSLLEEWIDFRIIKRHCVEIGLEAYLQQIESLHIEATDIVPIFKKRFFRLWIDIVLPELPMVAGFRKKDQSDLIEELLKQDESRLAIAKVRTHFKLMNSLIGVENPRLIAEMETLQQELSKQRGIIPIRRLFQKIPKLLLTLKPCLMMSPLSVSLFLDADSFAFDTVIFNGVSEAHLEHAVGAIVRGKQVIIVGNNGKDSLDEFSTNNILDEEVDSDDDDDNIDNDAYEHTLKKAISI